MNEEAKNNDDLSKFPPTITGLMGSSSFIDDILNKLDVSMLLRPGQILIEYNTSGAVVTGLDEKGYKIRDCISAKLTKDGINNVTSLMELMRFLSKFMKWNDSGEGHEISIGLSPNEPGTTKTMFDDIDDIVTYENIQKLYDKGYIILKAFED